jgi:hypothetical protein
MLLEHQFRDPSGAVEVVNAALEYLDTPLAAVPYDRVLLHHEAFNRRRKRLLHKLS